MENNECLVCGEPLLYLSSSELMKCEYCRKEEKSRTRCVNQHYVCNECHSAGIDQILNLCLHEESRNPILLFEKIVSLPFCHLHGPEHHIIVGASLLTAFKNSGGKIDLHSALLEMLDRGKSVPGGACGFWGACGAGISSGIFVSIISGSTPLAEKPFALSNLMTSESLNQIGMIGGPRCCKRDSYLSILQAVDFVKEHFCIEMIKPEVKCQFLGRNNQCIGRRCPFFP